MNPTAAPGFWQRYKICNVHLRFFKQHCGIFPFSRALFSSAVSSQNGSLYNNRLNCHGGRQKGHWPRVQCDSYIVNEFYRNFHCGQRTDIIPRFKFYSKSSIKHSRLWLPAYPIGHSVHAVLGLFKNTYVTKAQTSFTLRNKLYCEYLQSLEDRYNSLLEIRSSGTRHLDQEENQTIPLLQSIAEIFQRAKQKYEDLKELELMGKDEELKRLAEVEMIDAQSDIEELEDQLLSILIPPEKVDDCDVILEVESGAGGSESMLFAEEIFNMYMGLSEKLGWMFETISVSRAEKGGFKSASASVSGQGVYQRMKYEGGVHRVQRVPATESKGRVHTSTVTVAILPQPEKIDINLPKSDLKIESMRSSGPGGQNVNKSNSAVRIVHLPTGMVVECQEMKSNHKNLSLAMKKLESRLYEAQLRVQTSQVTSQRKIQVGNKDRSEKIRTYNFLQDRITDHRIGYSLSHLPSFMIGGPGLLDIMNRLYEGAQYETIEHKLQEFEKERSKGAQKVGKKT